MAIIFETPEERAKIVSVKANEVLNAPKPMFNNLLSTWNKLIRQIWLDPNPAEILAALGSEAQDIFTLSTQLANFLESVKPGCTAQSMALVKPVSFGPNGTVTLQ